MRLACPLLAKADMRLPNRWSGFDPNRKSRTPICCDAQQFPLDVVECRPPAWRAAHEATEVHSVDGRRGGVAARGARAAGRTDTAHRVLLDVASFIRAALALYLICRCATGMI